MKNKSLLLEILMIIIFILSLVYSIYINLQENEMSKQVSMLSGMFQGMPLGIIAIYWTLKMNILNSEHINKEKAIKTWQYILISFCLSSMIIQFFYVEYIFESIKPAVIFFFLWLMILGNFRSTIFPDGETATVYLDDDEVNRKTKRFTGKYLVFGGILGLLLVIISPQSISFYIFGSYFFLYLILPYFYAKRLFNQKYV